MFNLKDKTIIITGGAGLIGRAFTLACLKSGANVVVADLDEQKVSESTNKTSQLLFYKCDITSAQDVKALIKTVLDKFNRIDALVNCAYPKNENYGKKFEEVSYQDFCDNVNKHLGGYFLMSQQVLKVMKEQNYGNIINLASIYGAKAPRFEIYENTNITMPVEYAAIKAGVINLTKYLASYLGKYNIRVNAISPGGVFNNQPESFVKEYSKRVVLGERMAKKDDLTGVLLFLLSDQSKYITGQNIIVDGGWSL